MDTSGFYKLYEDGSVVYAPNFVYGPNITLERENKHIYNYPDDGWFWFDTIEEAYSYFNIELPTQEN